MSHFTDPQLLEKVSTLADLLLSKNWYIATAESCTGGGLGYALTAIPGSSKWYEHGFITYSNSAKHEQLGVPEKVLEEFGAVSAQTVEYMAGGAARYAKADVAVGISGIAGPDGGSVDKPVGLVWFGFFINGTQSSESCCFTGDRLEIRNQAVHFALDILNQRLIERR